MGESHHTVEIIMQVLEMIMRWGRGEEGEGGERERGKYLGSEELQMNHNKFKGEET